MFIVCCQREKAQVQAALDIVPWRVGVWRRWRWVGRHRRRRRQVRSSAVLLQRRERRRDCSFQRSYGRFRCLLYALLRRPPADCIENRDRRRDDECGRDQQARCCRR